MAEGAVTKMKGMMEPLVEKVKHPIKKKEEDKEEKEVETEQQEEEPELASGNITQRNPNIEQDDEDSITIMTSQQIWNVKMPPIKKHMRGEHLIHAPQAGLQAVIQKHRRLAIEVLALKDKYGKNSDDQDVQEPAKLQDISSLQGTEMVVLKVYKNLTKEPNHHPGVVDPLSVVGLSMAPIPGGPLGVPVIPMPKSTDSEEEDNWVEHARYKLQDVAILQKSLKKHEETVELKLGSGHEVIIRDFIFENPSDNINFQEMLLKTRELEHKRALQQIALYKERRGDLTEICVLVEIVSAMNLPVADVYSTDAYVICRMGNKEIHRTKFISQELDPIWTLSTGSLFLIQMTPEEFFSCSGGLVLVLKDYDSLGSNEVLGHVTVTLEELMLDATGERKEYNIITESEFSSFKDNRKPKLALRYKDATPDDVEFIKVHNKKGSKKAVGVYSSETFLPPNPPHPKFLKRQNKVDKEDHEKKHRVKPGPDPMREHETKWMTHDQIEEDAYKQSTNWALCGSGDLGKLYFEIIGCDGLTNADFTTLDLTDKTDAFCCVVFEDSIVNTDVIGNCLSPRWPSWSTRAFCFNISHPCSDVMLGVFDYDPEMSPVQLISRAASDLHDPVGRIRIDLSNFVHSTVYTLKYNLYYGEAAQDRIKPQGTITVRLRVQWKDIRKAYFASMKPPPMQYVALQKQIYFDVAHYTTEGVHDEKEFNMNTFTEYIEEMQSNKIIFEYMKAAAMTVWLWRGHYNVEISGKEYSLPLHSMAAFTWGILVTYNHNYFPAFIFFSIGWVMLACNEYTRQSPSPWHRSRSWYDLLNGTGENNIEPNQNLKEIEEYNASMAKRSQFRRHKEELEAKHDAAMKKELGDDVNEAETSEDLTTKKGNPLKAITQVNVNPLKPVLYPIQLKLHKIVTAFRIGKSIVLWEDGFYSFWIVTLSFVASAVTFFIPWGFIVTWLLRILVWVLLGPWMAIVDRIYFPTQEGLTDEEKDAKVEEELRAKYEQALKASTTYRVRTERAVKYKDMKKYMFGSFLVRVPRFQEDLYKDTPLPESSAKPYDEGEEPDINITQHKYGQHLTGDMIPQRDIQVEAMAEQSSPPKKTGFFGIKGLGDPEKMPLLGAALGPKNPLLAPAYNRKPKKYDACSNEKKTS